MSSTRRGLRVGLAVLGLATAAGGAARARMGGTLVIGLVGMPAPDATALADAPEAASARALLALPLCRLVPQRVPVLAAMARESGPEAEALVVTPLPGARLPDGTPLGTRDIAASWRRLAGEDGGAYLGLLAPVRGLDAVLDAALGHPETGLRLPLAHPWPDLESSLCHPAFTPGRAGAGSALGLYTPGEGGRLGATRGAPGGPPFPAALAFASVSPRATARLLQRGGLHAVLGEAGSGGEPGAMLFATYLIHRPGSLSEGVLAALAALDLAPLVRTFVPGPAAPMSTLLPSALMDPPLPATGPRRRAPAVAGARGFTLGYDIALPENRAVAERLQVLLHDLGIPVRLQGFDRAGLAQARAAGSVEAALMSVLLPPLPAPALAVVLSLAGDPELLGRELPALGAIADPTARAARVRERALALQHTLPIVPLFTRGLRARLSPVLVDARRDAFGLLVLDDAWLSD